MPVRALIVAIEKYPDVTDGSMAKELAGTLKAGLEFRDWLTEKWQREGHKPADMQLIFCSEPKQADGQGAKRQDLISAMRALQQSGQNATSELFFFFSGHGFSFQRETAKRLRADVIVTSDYQDADQSGNCCFNLSGIVQWLRVHLGEGRHYYFIDACRNTLTAESITINDDIMRFGPLASGDPTTFVLQSTLAGDTSPADGTFSTLLMGGLRGKSTSKIWSPNAADTMLVRYDSLRGYLKKASNDQITSKVEGTDGESDAVLATLNPAPKSKVIVKFNNPAPGLAGQLNYRGSRAGNTGDKPLGDQPLELQLDPDRYDFTVHLRGLDTDPPTPLSREIFDDVNLEFATVQARPRTAGPALESFGVPQATIDVESPAGTTFELRNMSSGRTETIDGTGTRSMPGGGYVGTLRTGEGRIIRRMEIELPAGQQSSVDLVKWNHSAPHAAIASRLDVTSHGVWFSEELGGPEQDADLDVWLALLGGGRIIRSQDSGSKIGRFPLQSFAKVEPGASPVYVLAGFEQPDTRLRVAFSTGGKVEWKDAEHAGDLAGIRQACHRGASGSLLVSLRVGDGAPYTVASFSSPNRATLVTLTQDDDGAPRVGHYLLPIGHLVSQLDPFVQDVLSRRSSLTDVRTLARATREFRKRRDVFAQLKNHELDQITYMKWLDPVASSLAVYELLRRRQTENIGEIVRNMKRYFADLPDTWALAKLSGEVVESRGTPLFLDGLKAFPDFAKQLPLPAGHLDFSSPWTAWKAAVGV